jgi:hypothetical protein
MLQKSHFFAAKNQANIMVKCAKVVVWLILLVIGVSAKGQWKQGRMLLKVAELPMGPVSAVDGACVAWHPIQKKYYAGMVGGPNELMRIFNEKGEPIDSCTTLANLRGLWYNPTKKLLEGNAVEYKGWFTYQLNEKGLPEKIEPVFNFDAVSNGQSVGAYLEVDAQGTVAFLFDISVHFFDATNGVFISAVTLPELYGDTKYEINQAGLTHTALVLATGMPEAELAFVNVYKRQIDFIKLGKGYSHSLIIPQQQPLYGAFNTAFANGILWMYDQQKKVWNGYQ